MYAEFYSPNLGLNTRVFLNGSVRVVNVESVCAHCTPPLRHLLVQREGENDKDPSSCTFSSHPHRQKMDACILALSAMSKYSTRA